MIMKYETIMRYWGPTVAGAIAVVAVISSFDSPERHNLLVSIPSVSEHVSPTNDRVPSYIGIEYNIAATASTSTLNLL
jgi:hypothetical protein